ncbi:malate synthase A [Amycolatopsis acidiphila]|uniref:Malate synthase n=1 Tax=Amycolatopsis acidiphila TaxID=715473 RepID=A0A558A8M5_9PSEU|nr:malate synthase A [Amycolatopsis acidiphila]TVT20615.1 malate synthase A [Amycolatopsis acidiphila]UIJ61389.1 malate synthase A [Amycolatopsis acidiphila]GHG77895.1 malate synthase [Amycolatopsis acidiphila]
MAQSSTRFTSRIDVAGPSGERFDEILTPAAVEFIAKLDNAFAGRRCELLDARRQRREKLASGEEQLGFLPGTRWVRNDSSWQVAPAGPGLEDRRVEITGPTDRKMTVNALNSGAKVWLADFEDATSPTWANIIGGQLNLFDAIRRNIDFTTESGKHYTIGDNPATIVARPRGWHLVEKHIRIDGRPVSASLVDTGLYFFHNARQLVARGSGPYFYLPKLESHLEARLWNDVFRFAQNELGIPQGTVRATVLIETITAAFEMEEILYELREHASGLNAGRWDYIFSLIKNFADHGADFVLPDRAQVTMTVPFMRSYTELLVSTCHKRGAYAIGGMAAFIPSKDPEVNAVAFEKVRQDKEREAGDGFDGSWVAHPGLVPVCDEVFTEVLGGWPNQLGRLRDDVSVSAEDLLNVASAGGEVTEKGVRGNINVALRYVDSWLRGTGAAAIFDLMEDAATAEIARCQVWQWVRNGTKLDDGTAVTPELVRTWLDEELADIRGDLGAGNRLDDAREIFVETALGEKLPSFLTTGAYARYLTELN